MAAPTGHKLGDGFATLISLPNRPSIALWEIETTPPGVDGGPKVDTTTMRNTDWETAEPQKLKQLTDGQVRCAYDEVVYLDIVSQTNVKQLIQVVFPTGRPLSFYGWLQSFKPDGLKKGTMPTAMVTFATGNTNAALTETAPTVGTTTSSTTTTSTTTAP